MNRTSRSAAPLSLLAAASVFLCAALSSPDAAGAQDLRRTADTLDAATASGESPMPIEAVIRHGRLDNGLTFYVRQNTRPENRAVLRLIVNAGSVLEDEDQLGLAHFLEHMAFNGTESFEKQEIIDYLERIGMQFGADINAYTGFDETVYMLEVPTDSADMLDTGLRILEEWALAFTLD